MSLKGMMKKLLPEEYLRLSKGSWREDNNYAFDIDQEVITSFFNKTQSLVFSDEDGRKEEEVILPFMHITKKSRVLDLGCGAGRWEKILSPKCKEYVGVDVSENFIQKAQKENEDNNNAHFCCMPAQDYLRDERYDLILIIGLITYMNDEDVTQTAANCRKMLAKGGRLILRSIAIKETGTKRKVYCYKPNLIWRLLGRHPYQIIRRSVNEEIRLFEMFSLEHQCAIEGTEYTLYIFG